MSRVEFGHIQTGDFVHKDVQCMLQQVFKIQDKHLFELMTNWIRSKKDNSILRDPIYATAVIELTPSLHVFFEHFRNRPKSVKSQPDEDGKEVETINNNLQAAHYGAFFNYTFPKDINMRLCLFTGRSTQMNLKLRKDGLGDFGMRVVSEKDNKRLDNLSLGFIN